MRKLLLRLIGGAIVLVVLLALVELDVICGALDVPLQRLALLRLRRLLILLLWLLHRDRLLYTVSSRLLLLFPRVMATAAPRLLNGLRRRRGLLRLLRHGQLPFAPQRAVELCVARFLA